MASTFWRHIPCGICGKDDIKMLGEPKPSEKIQRLITDVEKVSIVKCKGCGFYYTDPMPFWREEDLQVLYDEEYFPGMTKWWKKMRIQINPRRRLDAIERYAYYKITRFLEIGCGEGYAMQEAKRRGWSIYGQDVSRIFADKAKARLGAKIFVGQLKDAQFPENYFDVIYVDSVLEHVQNPLEMVMEFHRILRPGGIAYVIVPNEDALINDFRSLIFKLQRSKRCPKLEPLQQPYHIVGFTKHTLRILCEKTGFKIKRISICSGADELYKYKIQGIYSLARDCFLHPAYFLGEILGKGTTLEVVISVHPA